MDHLTVPVTGGDLFVARWGSGPPVLAVHGITGSHAAWPWVADRLVGAVSLIAPDLRGRGASNGLPGLFGMAAHAADLVAVLDHLDVTRAVVVGHSMGAWIGATRSAEPAGAVPVRHGGGQAPAEYPRCSPRARGGHEPLHARDGRRRRGGGRPHAGGRARSRGLHPRGVYPRIILATGRTYPTVPDQVGAVAEESWHAGRQHALHSGLVGRSGDPRAGRDRCLRRGGAGPGDDGHERTGGGRLSRHDPG
ncbi:MAG: alpha/beta fold hydrolase, partial [Acidobacteria bacterium]|nr:alpha/beta fold hydrolase [Acidobacteriota bacterium]